MENKNIKYIGYYDFQDSNVPRDYVVAATNKMEYIIDVLIKKGYDVDIISVSPVSSEKFKWYKGETVKRKEHLTAKFFTSWGGNFKLLRVFRVLWHQLAIFLFLIFKVKRGEKILVYHSLGYGSAILLAKYIKGFHLILEVEEIYCDVSQFPKRTIRLEHKMFNIANSYIFSTELLIDKLNKQAKPYTVIYGTYRLEKKVSEKFYDEKKHIVYAGTFDPNKGGAVSAIESTRFLDSNYHMHILGFGSKKDVEYVINLIDKVRAMSKATIEFHGLIKGDEYIEFIQKCHVGLSVQNPNAAFNTTSFPSKILSYMANGLTVVTVKIDAITNSAISDYMSFYDEPEPSVIAKQIMATDINNNNRECIKMLNAEFEKSLDLIL